MERRAGRKLESFRLPGPCWGRGLPVAAPAAPAGTQALLGAVLPAWAAPGAGLRVPHSVKELPQWEGRGRSRVGKTLEWPWGCREQVWLGRFMTPSCLAPLLQCGMGCVRCPCAGRTVTHTQPGEASCGCVWWAGAGARGSGAPKCVHGVKEGRALQCWDGGAPQALWEGAAACTALLRWNQPCSAPETWEHFSPWLFQLET